MATQSEEWNDNPMDKGEQTRAVKTHFNLSNLSFSLLREQQCFLPTARTGWGYVAMASWCLLLSCTVLSPPVHSSPFLSSPLLLSHTVLESTGFASTLQSRQVCVCLEGKGREAPSLLTPLSTGSAFSTPSWFGHSDIATGSDMFPPITYVSKQVPDTLLCQPSSKHLCAVRKSTCWPQRAALLTAKWLIVLTEGQKNWHWGVWTKPLPLDCRHCGGMVKYK